jgi:hypothetical protein
MAHNIRVRGVRRKQIDEDELALAFLLLAKVLHEQGGESENATHPAAHDELTDPTDNQPEAA